MKYRKGTFVTIPNIERLDVVPAISQALFIWICKYSDDEGTCFPSRKKLATHIGVDVRTIDKHLGFLEETGFLTKEIRKKPGTKENMSNLYQIQIVRDPSESNDTTSSEPNVPVTKPSINQIQLTKVVVEQAPTPEPSVITTDKIPDNRGKTYILRVISIYYDLFRQKYGFDAKVSIPRVAKQIKDLCTRYTEFQVAALLIVFFNWSGMTGGDQFEADKLTKAANPFGWFYSSVTQYEVYLRNIQNLKFDDPGEVRKFVVDYILGIKK